MQADVVDEIEEVEISPIPPQVSQPLEIIWDDDKIERVRIICLYILPLLIA